MKRLTAWVLALMMLASCFGALAEKWPGTQITLKNMNVRLLGSSNTRKVKLKDMLFYIRVGSVDGNPTLQLDLKYGEDQRLDSAVQVQGSKLLIYTSGIAGAYTVDLEELAEQPGEGAMAAAAFGAGLASFGEHPKAVLRTLMPKDESNNHVLRLWLPAQTCADLLRRFLEAAAGDDEMLEASINGVLEDLTASDDPIMIGIRYNRKEKKMWLYFRRAGKGIRIYGRTSQKTGDDIHFINVGAEEAVHDLLHLDQETRYELQGELLFLGIKIGAFLKHSSLKHLIQ